jgi:hypothetical protein
MSKVRGAEQPPSEANIRVRRKRSALITDPNDAFARAFVDALRDILQEEIRTSHS